MKQRVLRIVEPLCLIVVPFAMLLCVYLNVPNSAVVTAVIAGVALIPFFLDFEWSHIRARDLMPIVVMSALGVAGRIVFAPLPAIKPVTAIVIVTAMSFGRQSGFFTGILCALVSNIFFGQGPWTPWQMYAWGTIGYITGTLATTGIFERHKWFIYVYGVLMSYFYGGLLDAWTYIGFVQPWTLETAAVTFGGGAIYNLGHALGTALFLVPIAGSWSRKFERVKRKYGIGSND